MRLGLGAGCGPGACSRGAWSTQAGDRCTLAGWCSTPQNRKQRTRSSLKRDLARSSSPHEEAGDTGDEGFTEAAARRRTPAREGLGGGKLADGRRDVEDGQARCDGTWASAGSGGRRPWRGDPLVVAVMHVQARGGPRRVRAGGVQEAREAGVLQMRTGVGDGLRELRRRRRTAGRRCLMEPGGGGAKLGQGMPDPGRGDVWRSSGGDVRLGAAAELLWPSMVTGRRRGS